MAQTRSDCIKFPTYQSKTKQQNATKLMTLQFSNLTWEGKRTCDWVCRSLFVWTTLHGSPGASHRSRIPKVLTDYMEHHHTHHQHHDGYSEHLFPSVKIETSKFNLHLQQDDVKMTFDVAPAAAPNLRQSSARSTECVTFFHFFEITYILYANMDWEYY